MEIDRAGYEISSFASIGITTVSLTALSEYVQRNLDIYRIIESQIGKQFADFVLGQLGDVMTPIALNAIIAVAYLRLARFDSEKEKVALVTSMGVVASLLFIIQEVSNMLDVPEACGYYLGLCEGEVSDMLAFSVPLLAAVAFRTWRRKKMRDRIRKLREESKHWQKSKKRRKKRMVISTPRNR